MTQLNFMVKLHPSSQLQIHEYNGRGVAFSLKLNHLVRIMLEDIIALVNHQLKNLPECIYNPITVMGFSARQQ